MGGVLSHRSDNHAPYLAARAITAAGVGTDLDELVITRRASCFSGLGLAIPGFMSVLGGRSLVSDLHSVPQFEPSPVAGIPESRGSVRG